MPNRLHLALLILVFSLTQSAKASTGLGLPSYPAALTQLQGSVYFAATSADDARLWRYDTVTKQVSLAADIDEHPGVNTKIGFTARYRDRVALLVVENDLQLWTYHPDSGTVNLRSFGPAEPHGLYVANDTLFVSLYRATTGYELWSVLDNAASVLGKPSNPRNVVILDDRLYFRDHSGGLVRTDGTVAGTSIVSPQAGVLVAGPDRLYFQSGTGICRYSSAEGEGLIEPDRSMNLAKVVNGVLYYVDGSTLYRTTGESLGSKVVAQNVVLSQPLMGAAGARFVFVNNGKVYAEVQDGAGLVELKSLLVAQDSEPVVGSADFLLFAQTGWGVDNELFITDGTVAGTGRLRDINQRRKPNGETGTLSSQPDGFFRIGNEVLFVADDGLHGRELWASDGTAAGTRIVANIRVEGSISGTVTGDGVTPLLNASVHVYDEYERPVTSTPVRPDGTYTVQGLRSELYRVFALSGNRYIAKWWRSAEQCPFCTSAGAFLVPVVPPEVTRDIDFALERGGQIAGTVRNRMTGAAVPNSVIRVRSIASGKLTSTFPYSAERYAFGAQAPGDYLLSVTAPGYEPQAWTNVRCSATCDGYVVQVRTGELFEANFTMVPLGGSFEAKPSDFDGGGKADLFWQNASSGQNVVHLMNGPQVASVATVNWETDPSWTVAGFGDFDGDGKRDVLWRNSRNGMNWIYFMDGATIRASQRVNVESDLNWKIAGIGDFNGDGKSDIFWRNVASGMTWLYQMNGATIVASSMVSQVPELDWRPVAVSDFNGDGRSDVFWRNVVNGNNWIYLMNGAAIISSSLLNQEPDQLWQVAGVGDYNGDGRGDLLWRHSGDGANWIFLMNGAAISAQGLLNREPDQNWKIAAGGDFDGDGKSDVFWRNSSTGQNWLYLLDAIAVKQSSAVTQVPDLDWKVIQSTGF